MFTRIRIAIGLVLGLLLLFAAPALAGGWAVISLDELPTRIVAGEPLTIGFTVLQHGRTPLEGLDPTITANLYKEQEFTVPAESGDMPGHYTATLVFPKEGEWRWSIQAFTMDQPMPLLNVAPAPVVSASTTVKVEPAASLLPWFGGLSLAVGLIGAVIAFRQRSRWAAVLTVASLLAAIPLFITAASPTPEVEAQAEMEFKSSISQVEYGRQLFVAKGCITCHYNSRAASPSEYWTIEMGAPNLSKFSANPEVIAMRLKDPSSVKSDTNMPDLGLSEAEIDALVAFLNTK